jgi:hypothetical protein
MSQPLHFPKVFLFSNPPNSGSAENILAPPNSHTLHSGVVQAPDTIFPLMGHALSFLLMQPLPACNMNRYLSGLHANLTDLQARLENGSL